MEGKAPAVTTEEALQARDEGQVRDRRAAEFRFLAEEQQEVRGSIGLRTSDFDQETGGIIGARGDERAPHTSMKA